MLRAATAPVTVGVAGAAVTLIGIGVPAPWRDEQATASAASRSWEQLGDLVFGPTDGVHALYYALMHLWVGAAGIDPFWLRVPSALAIGLAAAGMVVLGRQLDRTWTGVIAATVLLAIPRTFAAGGEARSYALQPAAVVWLVVVFLWVMRRDGAGRWVVLSVLTAAAGALFLYLALIPVGLLLGMMIDRDWRRRLLPAMAAFGAAGAALIPLAVVASGQSGQVSWLPEIGLGIVGTVIKDQWFLGQTLFAVIAWLLVIAGLVAIIRTRLRRNNQLLWSRRQLLALLLPWAALPTVALILISVVATPAYLPRYVVMSLPAIALLIAIGLARMPRLVAVAALVALVAASMPSAIAQRTPTAFGDWGQIEAAIENAAEPGDAIYFTADDIGGDVPRGITTFSPDLLAGLDDLALVEPAATAGTLHDRVRSVEDAVARLAPDQRLIAVLTHDNDPRDSDDVEADTVAAFRAAGLVEMSRVDTGLTVISIWEPR